MIEVDTVNGDVLRFFGLYRNVIPFFVIIQDSQGFGAGTHTVGDHNDIFAKSRTVGANLGNQSFRFKWGSAVGKVLQFSLNRLDIGIPITFGVGEERKVSTFRGFRQNVLHCTFKQFPFFTFSLHGKRIVYNNIEFVFRIFGFFGFPKGLRKG